MQKHVRMIFGLAIGLAFALTTTLAEASPLGPDGEPGRAHPGKFVWFDLATDDQAGARAFYGTVFGWRFRPVEGASSSYTLIEHEGGKVGGMFLQSRPPGASVGPRCWRLCPSPIRPRADLLDGNLARGGRR